MHKQYRKFDKELIKNDFLRRHYECLPFIGEKYEEHHLLLIGESHYVPTNEIPLVNRNDFYDISFDDLGQGEYRKWINTRYVFESRVYEKVNFKCFFSNPATEIARIINQTSNPSFDQKIAAMHEYAFINYFKRPSYNKGKTITELSCKDYYYAYNISKEIIEILKPNHIIFLSKKAYYAFCDLSKNDEQKQEYTLNCVSHPCSIWWNRKRKDGKSARQDFYDFLSVVLK